MRRLDEGAGSMRRLGCVIAAQGRDTGSVAAGRGREEGKGVLWRGRKIRRYSP
jgi:hypothetical protein